jgi:hypothetical protein
LQTILGQSGILSITIMPHFQSIKVHKYFNKIVCIVFCKE